MFDFSGYDKIVHLITPGIDSVCTYFYIDATRPYNDDRGFFNQSLELVHMPISPKYSQKEMSVLTNTLSNWFYHDINILPFDNKNIREESDGFISSRNLLIASVIDASIFVTKKEKTLLSFSFTSDDRVYDSSEQFCSDINKCLNLSKLDSVVKNLSKLELASWFLNDYDGLKLDVKKKILLNTYSCYSGEEECLRCSACFRKSVILSNLGLVTRWVPEDFLRMRLNILKEKVSEERKSSIKRYVESLMQEGMIGSEFKEFI